MTISTRKFPAPALDPANAAASETVVLAGGCFWGQQAVFEHVKGVTRVVAGYSGGAKETATYPQVTTETTGHAESVQITFDPRVVSFGKLLQVYFSVAHDPTDRWILSGHVYIEQKVPCNHESRWTHRD